MQIPDCFIHLGHGSHTDCDTESTCTTLYSCSHFVMIRGGISHMPNCPAPSMFCSMVMAKQPGNRNSAVQCSVLLFYLKIQVPYFSVYWTHPIISRTHI